MIVKLVEKRDAPFIAHKICYYNTPVTINDKFIDEFKAWVDKADFQILDGDEWISAKSYFGGYRKTTVTADIKVQQNDYDFLFNGHWKKQIKNVQDYTSDYDEVEKILEFAKEHDVSDGTIGGIEEYLLELE